ncbi:MAG: hypothetical protein Q8K59_12855, partial [Nitrosomonas sp.]|nr:hypothetical protein [Nitrosomonas sp.]MDP1951951.1 hypothetical protein [Nitrosomonas sp.]
MQRFQQGTAGWYGLARDISSRANTFAKVNFYLLSERLLSEKVQAIEDKLYQGWTFTYNIWDIARLHRIKTSRGAKEEVVIDFETMFGQGIPCLPAHIKSADYESYLMVMPATILGVCRAGQIARYILITNFIFRRCKFLAALPSKTECFFIFIFKLNSR